jgi:hypothetical protein
MARVTIDQDAALLVNYMAHHLDQPITRHVLAHRFGWGVGSRMEARLSRARDKAADQGYALSYVLHDQQAAYMLTAGASTKAITKSDERLLKTRRTQGRRLAQHSQFVAQHATDPRVAQVGQIQAAMLASATTLEDLLIELLDLL